MLCRVRAPLIHYGDDSKPDIPHIIIHACCGYYTECAHTHSCAMCSHVLLNLAFDMPVCTDEPYAFTIRTLSPVCRRCVRCSSHHHNQHYAINIPCGGACMYVQTAHHHQGDNTMRVAPQFQFKSIRRVAHSHT